MAKAKAKLRLKELLGEKSLYWLATETKIDYKTLHKHLKGTSSSIRLDHIKLLCDALDCTPETLFLLPKRK